MPSALRARKYTDNVEWSPEDATRTDPDFLCAVVETAIKAGATTINIPDTVGYTMPQEYFETVTMLRDRVPNIDNAVISTHCHNDLGLAVANSLAGVQAGARQIECTINGIGERAGNAALEEIVMAMNVRGDLMAQWTNIETTMLARASRLVSSVTAFPVQYNKAIVGQNAFAHESGIHQDGMLKNNQTYEIMTPESVGISQSSLVMGKHSGRHAFREKIHELGYEGRQPDAGSLFAFQRSGRPQEARLTMTSSHWWMMKLPRVLTPSSWFPCVTSGSEGPQSADLELEINGEKHAVHSTGDGPVDAPSNRHQSPV